MDRYRPAAVTSLGPQDTAEGWAAAAAAVAAARQLPNEVERQLQLPIGHPSTNACEVDSMAHMDAGAQEFADATNRCIKAQR